MAQVVDAEVVFADAFSEDGIDYGTGYYVTKYHKNGNVEYFGPYNYEEDALLVRSTVY